MRGNTKKFALKSAVAVAATAAMVVPMAACGSGTAGGGKTKISFYSYFKDNQIGEVVKGFEKKNPDITLDVQYGQDPAQYISTLQTRLAGGKPPTIFNLTMDNRTDVMKSGAALDISGEDFLDGIDDTNFALFQQDGKTYGMPVSAWVGVFFYNKDILKKAGYDKFPKTWDEFIEMGKKINSNGSTAFLEDFNTQIAGSFTGLLASYYGEQGKSGDLDADIWSGKSTFTKDWTPVFKKWEAAAKAGVIPQKSVGLSGDQVKQEFVSGNLASCAPVHGICLICRSQTSTSAWHRSRPTARKTASGSTVAPTKLRHRVQGLRQGEGRSQKVPCLSQQRRGPRGVYLCRWHPVAVEQVQCRTSCRTEGCSG